MVSVPKSFQLKVMIAEKLHLRQENISNVWKKCNELQNSLQLFPVIGWQIFLSIKKIATRVNNLNFKPNTEK